MLQYRQPVQPEQLSDSNCAPPSSGAAYNVSETSMTVNLSAVKLKDLMNECVRRGAIKEFTNSRTISAAPDLRQDRNAECIQRQMAVEMMKTLYDSSAKDVLHYTWRSDVSAHTIDIKSGVYVSVHPTQVDRIW